MTPHNRGVYTLQANLDDDDDSTLTPKGSNSICGDLHGLSLYSCWVCGMEGYLSQYCSKIADGGRYGPDPHIPNLYNRRLPPQPSDIGLQRETSRINKVNGPNHLDLGDKNSKTQA